MGLNRRARRSLGKKGVFESVVDQTLRKQQEEVELRTVENTITLTCMVLHDRFGFGKKRWIDFVREINELSNKVSEGYVSIKELKEQLIEEMKLETVLKTVKKMNEGASK